MSTLKPIQIFDLDGTLTIEFDKNEGDRTGEGLDTYNYWHRITRILANNPEEFDSREKSWLDMVMTTKNIDLLQALIERTKTEIIRFADSDKNDDAIRRQARLLTQKFFTHGILEFDGIEYLKYQLKKGTVCVISTGGDEYGAAGFIDGLVDCKLLPQNLANKIIVSGTRLNWEKMSVSHLNVGPLKLRGLELVFQQPLDEIKEKIQAVFVNEPDGGDLALSKDLCQIVFVKKTVKNMNSDLPSNCVFFSNWSDIYQSRNKIDKYHSELLRASKG